MNNDVTWLWDDLGYHDGQISEDVETSNLFEEDEWEDGDFVESIHKKFPNWYLVKMLGFSWSTFIPVEEWCKENVKHGEWKKVGWETGCSYSVGVVFSHSRDAMMFKLRWR
jgi:hypothetical protein